MNSIAQTLALLVVAEEQQPGEDRDSAIYATINRSHLLAQMSEECKADLYARVVEHGWSHSDFFKLQIAISESMYGNLKAFPYG